MVHPILNLPEFKSNFIEGVWPRPGNLTTRVSTIPMAAMLDSTMLPFFISYSRIKRDVREPLTYGLVLGTLLALRLLNYVRDPEAP